MIVVIRLILMLLRELGWYFIMVQVPWARLLWHWARCCDRIASFSAERDVFPWHLFWIITLFWYLTTILPSSQHLPAVLLCSYYSLYLRIFHCSARLLQLLKPNFTYPTNERLAIQAFSPAFCWEVFWHMHLISFYFSSTSTTPSPLRSIPFFLAPPWI